MSTATPNESEVTMSDKTNSGVVFLTDEEKRTAREVMMGMVDFGMATSNLRILRVEIESGSRYDTQEMKGLDPDSNGVSIHHSTMMHNPERSTPTSLMYEGVRFSDGTFEAAKSLVPGNVSYVYVVQVAMDGKWQFHLLIDPRDIDFDEEEDDDYDDEDD